MTKHNIS